jgi:hypothetical protein
MPYIKNNDGRRTALRDGDTALTAGELNYQIFYYLKHNNQVTAFNKEVVKGFFAQFLGETPSYQKYNDMVGVSVLCMVELDRRLKIDADFLLDIASSYKDEISTYEDKKILENSDVE